MKPDHARLRAALGSEDLAWLVDRLRRRFEHGPHDAVGVVTLASPTPGQRQACDRLFGRRPAVGGSLTVNLGRLERIVVEGELAGSLSEAIEALTGVLVDRQGERDRKRKAWEDLFDCYRPAVVGREELRQWYEDLRGQGMLHRMAGGDTDRARMLLEPALRVVERLPASGIGLAQLAAECCGDSHALDPGQPVGTLVVRAAAVIGGVVLGPTASARRRAWDAAGVICDELSAPVLALNLPGACASLTSELLRQCAARGEPCRITSRQLLRHAPQFDASALGGVVYVCENPSVVAAAADALRCASRPLVSIDGQPTTGTRLLLSTLRRAGAVLRYHGDFDWGGVRIANRVLTDYGAEPWRISAEDYLAAVARGGRELAGDLVEAKWDALLAPTMAARRVAVHEERVLSMLLEDLRWPSNGQRE